MANLQPSDTLVDADEAERARETACAHEVVFSPRLSLAPPHRAAAGRLDQSLSAPREQGNARPGGCVARVSEPDSGLSDAGLTTALLRWPSIRDLTLLTRKTYRTCVRSNSGRGGSLGARQGRPDTRWSTSAGALRSPHRQGSLSTVCACVRVCVRVSSGRDRISPDPQPVPPFPWKPTRAMLCLPVS
jgi:hypothetical protein